MQKHENLSTGSRFQSNFQMQRLPLQSKVVSRQWPEVSVRVPASMGPVGDWAGLGLETRARDGGSPGVSRCSMHVQRQRSSGPGPPQRDVYRRPVARQRRPFDLGKFRDWKVHTKQTESHASFHFFLILIKGYNIHTPILIVYKSSHKD